MLSIPHIQGRRSLTAPPAPGGQSRQSQSTFILALLMPDTRRTLLPNGELGHMQAHRARQRLKRLSKNCRTLKKYAWLRSSATTSDAEPSVEDVVERELARVQQHIWDLEQRRLVLESINVTRRTNALALVSEKIHDYYNHFQRGYDPTKCSARGELLERVLRSVVQEDVQSPEFSGIDVFLRRWENYSKYHSEVVMCIDDIQPLEEISSENEYTVKATGYTTFRISRDTLKHFFRPILRNEQLVQQLIGKQYAFPFATIFHFNTEGRVFHMEPRADLAAALLNLVSNPYVTAQLLEASQLTDDGCLRAYPDDDNDTERFSPINEPGSDSAIACSPKPSLHPE
ncbi:TPA: hypothetical protein N0F65_012102 [Lagenidium giganteum]|uniref:Uncharacterized protein n=1 Tax=Lagenidium giganteum TaxID=4803 RepID=A0AAV2YSJ1_9STRA|nr:TPA: hypothetical protein N0F65_012102 [Lagenidium giganteum]